MNWLTKGWEEHSVLWLLLTTIVAGIAGLVSSWFALKFKRQELIESTIAAIKERQGTLEIETEQARRDRVRQEILRWANPILDAVQSLISRLKNILEAPGYLALNPAYDSNQESNWSITHDYFLPSTVYLFAQCFARFRMLQEKLSFELFQSEQAKDAFFEAIEKVNTRLGRYPANFYAQDVRCTGRDAQVFRLQQRAMGELLILRGENERCMSYPEFLEKLKTDTGFEQQFEPVKMLVLNLNRDDPSDARHLRLKATLAALLELEGYCKKLLAVPESMKRG